MSWGLGELPRKKTATPEMGWINVRVQLGNILDFLPIF